MGRSTYRLGQFVSNIVPNGTKNGVNQTFTLPGTYKYQATTLLVHLNGNLYRPDSITTFGDQVTFQIAATETLPISTDVLTCSFVTSS